MSQLSWQSGVALFVFVCRVWGKYFLFNYKEHIFDFKNRFFF